MSMVRLVATVIAMILATSSSPASPLRVASLHPITSDLARQVGGPDVEVMDLMPADANPHAYYPTPSDLKKASEAALLLAAGKGLEPYLDEVTQSLGGSIRVLEAGRMVPSLRVEADEVFVCCPSHATGAIDPHWWHSIQNARRASWMIAETFAEMDPEHASGYRARFTDFAAELDRLHRWAKDRIAEIPRADRELTTSHAAFGYLCRELGLRSITVLGLTTEQDPDPAYLKDVIATLRKHKVRAVFPEENANPAILASLARDAGVVVAPGLHADTLPPEQPTYAGLIRHNINTIVDALTAETP